MFERQTVVVTGGTGSFGHYIARMLLKHKAKRVVIFSRDEKKQDDMRYEFRDAPAIEFVIGDVRDPEATRRVMEGADTVFHAAALKQVPSCEYNVREAVLTNVLGAQNVIEACRAARVPAVVAVSTDKAVKPVNTMGMTKALQERLFIGANLSGKGVFSCVRYGNVIGSRGSVVPLFRKQIDHGGPLTVTDPRMTRFSLTLGQAIGLVFAAAKDARGGEIYVKKLSAIRVGDLARVMVDAATKSERIKIRTVGVRPGEKLHEVLISEEEAHRTVEYRDHFVVLPHIGVPRTERRYRGLPRTRVLEYGSGTAHRMTRSEIARLLQAEGILSLHRANAVP